MARHKLYENVFGIGWDGSRTDRFERLVERIEANNGHLTSDQRESLEGSFFGRGEAVRLARVLSEAPENKGLRLSTSTPPSPAWGSRGGWGEIIV